MLTDMDESRLKSVHPDLVRVVRTAAKHGSVKFIVIEGLRTAERQKALFEAGHSKTMNSRHLTGHAIDLGVLGRNGEVRWDAPAYRQLADEMKAAAHAEKVEIEWGGDFKGFFDGPHFQLPRNKYPGDTTS